MRRGKLRATMVAFVIAAAAGVLPGCINGDHYYITTGTGTYVNIREGATRFINTGIVPACGGDRHCVARTLRGLDSNSTWQQATQPSEVNDMWLDAIGPSFWNHKRCPTFKLSGFAIDWMTHSCNW